MKIRSRLLVATALTALIVFYLLGKGLSDDVKRRYFQVLEDGLLETAQIIAAMQNDFSDARLMQIAGAAPKMRLYATNAKGIVIFDSAGFGLGKDYSRWNDVYLTLLGKPGARSSRDDSRYPGVSVKYVAAPVKLNGRIVGVVTASKPAVTLEQAIAATKDKILFSLLIAFLGFLALTFGITFWITRPLGALTHYVQNLREGKRPALPALGNSEIKELGREFELMRNQLDGRQYVENFTSLMTHEFKSPLASIMGAAEILSGGVDSATHSRFLSNITREAERMNLITENMLALSRLENQRELKNLEWVDVNEILQTIIQSYSDDFRLKLVCDTALKLRGNYFLLYQAITNLIENACDFTPISGTIEISARAEKDSVVVDVKDSGVGVPAFALGRVFEKFYSLERPQSSRKGTGLGLVFVLEVARLHGGHATLANNVAGGATATLTLKSSTT